VHDRGARLSWFKSVILPHEAALRRRVRRLATPDMDVDDIVAEVLVRAYSVAGYERIDRGRNFLFTVARNLLTDLARRRAVVSFDMMADLESLAVADEAPSSESVVSARDELRRLQRIVDAMPPQCRKVFLMRRIDELPLADIAARLALSVSTVEKHLAKAMTLLTRGMEESDPVSTIGGARAWRRRHPGR
jgi:RNA polymerase sigma factor (sigma-70 family)